MNIQRNSREAEGNSLGSLDFARSLTLATYFPEKITAWRIDLDEGVRLVIDLDIAIWTFSNLAREKELSLGSGLMVVNYF